MEDNKGNEYRTQRRKVTRMGNSWAVSLPKMVMEKLEINPDDSIDFIENKEGDIYMKKAQVVQNSHGLDPKVVEMAQRIYHKNKSLFDKLKDY